MKKIYGNTEKQQKLVKFELITSIVGMILFYFIVSMHFWNYEYIDIILKDWNTSPIVDFKSVWVLDQYGQVLDNPENCPEGFEDIAKAYWYGFNQGCICPKSKYPDVDDVSCSDDQVRDDCIQVEFSPYEKLSIVGGKKFCAKRDDTWNYATALHPILNEDKKYECKDEKMTQLCGDADIPINLICIP